MECHTEFCISSPDNSSALPSKEKVIPSTGADSGSHCSNQLSRIPEMENPEPEEKEQMTEKKVSAGDSPHSALLALPIEVSFFYPQAVKNNIDWAE